MRISLHRPGLLTTVQDGGRWGYQALGVPPAGPMDGWSHRLANLLAGNRASAPGLEITGTGPDMSFEHPTIVAVAGAEFDGTLDGRRWTTPAVLETRAGSRLTFGERRRGLRAYVAVAGGLDVPHVLGSAATDLRSGLGGLEGRSLRVGDTLVARAGDAAPRPPRSIPMPALPSGSRCRLRVVAGPDESREARQAYAALSTAGFTVTPQSDRMGYRLSGMQLDGGSAAGISAPVVTGAIQLLPSGDPVLLMVERQTTGGYPIVAVVIDADLPLAGQLGPGDSVSFEPCAPEAALAALAASEQLLLALEDA
jgi:biotin-dependent carboxylase-like uncharacterized protein